MTLLAIGLGYCAQRFVRARGGAGTTLGTIRDRTRLATLAQAGFAVAFFDGRECDEAVREAALTCENLLLSAPPDENGDPALAVLGAEFRAGLALRRIVYLSTIGVYGDYGGAWVDEDAPLQPVNRRGERRIEAENAWLRFGEETGARVFVLRLGGIYGPGRNPLAAVAAGSARRLAKPGQVFNRIHVEDIARTIEACLASDDRGGVFNLVDDEPTAPGDPILFAARLLEAPEPPEIPFDEADMSPMARSFWSECKRVSNKRLKKRLRLALAYPTYREGLRALYSEGEGRGREQ